MQTKSRKKKLKREKTLHSKREEHRLSRLDIRYNPNKPLPGQEHTPKLNRNFRITKPIRGKKIINFPKRMNFGDDKQNTINLINSIHQEAVYGLHSVVFLNHRELESISPDAALVLIAELDRSMKYCGSRRIRGNYPAKEEVAALLTEIGFYKFLNIAAPKGANNKSRRTFVKIRAGNASDGRIADNLISNFEKTIIIDPIARKRLYESLIECMDNVHAHAYRKHSNSDDLLGEWWMAGFCDPITYQVAFVFWDQGVGIPTTLKERLSIKIKGYTKWSETNIIKKAVNEGVSRRNSDRHGNGLPSLKGFIDELAPDGILRVISNYGDYLYCKNHKSRGNDMKTPLNGSLIVWTVNPDEKVLDPDGILDLSNESCQLRLEI